MKWEDRQGSSNVRVSRGKAVGGGIGGIIIGLILWLVFGMNPMTAMQTGQAITKSTGSQQQQQSINQDDRDQRFVSVVLADTEVVWQQIFRENGMQYKNPQLIIFSGAVQSACGSASSATGPFYCPADQKVYLDTQFFADMKRQMGITGEQAGSTELSSNNQAGDFAQAYVIAHEVGHHVQTLLGISNQVRQMQAQTSQKNANQLSVRQELQADCFAGLWAHHNHKRTQFLQRGDIEEALDAAEKIGDDYLQHKAHGHSVPDSFTHGTSEQRKRWFYRGFESGDIKQCDTFGVKQI